MEPLFSGAWRRILTKGNHQHEKKRIAAALTALALAAGMYLPAGAAFSDTTGHWAESAIDKWSQEYGIIQGYEDGTFGRTTVLHEGLLPGFWTGF